MEKVLVIMGPTGSGKSRLSVELGTRFPSEIINSDKIQLYKGLKITTNQIPIEEQCGVPHHLLGFVQSESHGELTPAQYRSLASNLISDITARGKLPIVVGGSNSYVYALLGKEFNPNLNLFAKSGSGSGFESESESESEFMLNDVSFELRYNCCFIFTYVSLPVLNDYLGKRVDEMVVSGLLQELSEFYNSNTSWGLDRNFGLWKAIGVPEFEAYFKEYGPDGPCSWKDDQVRKGLYEKALKAMKNNTYKLASNQVKKIEVLKQSGWNMNKVDGTEAFKAILEGSKGNWEYIWENRVVEPSVEIVKVFLESNKGFKISDPFKHIFSIIISLFNYFDFRKNQAKEANMFKK